MSIFDGGAKEAQRAAERAATEERLRQERIQRGTMGIRSLFAKQFTPAYYGGLEKASTTSGNRQLDAQYADSLAKLKFSLARTGTLRSTARSSQEAQFGGRYDLARQQIAENARQLANQRKGDVANAENVAVTQLQASADPAAAAAQAANMIQANSYVPQYQPLGQIFTDLTGTLATQADLERTGRNRYGVNNPVSSFGNKAKQWFNVGAR
jgi:hypothetical protein